MEARFQDTSTELQDFTQTGIYYPIGDNINFRDVVDPATFRFNGVAFNIANLVHGPDEIPQLMRKELKQFYLALEEICDNKDERHRIFSQFLQSCSYYYPHAAVNYQRRGHKELMTQLLLQLICSGYYSDTTKKLESLFFNQGKVWVDPKSEYTTLLSICRENYKALFDPLLTVALKTIGKLNSQNMRDFFRHQNKDGFNALHMVVFDNRPSMFKKIVTRAENIFGGRYSKAYCDFLNDETPYGSSLLHLSLLSEDPMMVFLVLALIDRNAANDDEYYAALNRRNIWGETPRELARVDHLHPHIPKLLNLSRSELTKLVCDNQSCMPFYTPEINPSLFNKRKREVTEEKQPTIRVEQNNMLGS